MIFLDVHQLVFHSPQGQTLLRNLSFSMQSGELVCLLGPSGCGKTSLLRCLAGLNPCTGSIRLGGQEISDLPPQKRRIGMVFQHHALFPHLTVAENIAFGLRLQKIPASEQAARVRESLALMELSGMEQRMPATLSGGEKQRVSLARSLVLRPRLLFLDEPLASLDAPIRRSLRAHIRTIQQELGISTLFVTHDQEEALSIADRVFLMNQGALVQIGSPEELYTRPNSLFSARFMGASLFTPQQAQILLKFPTRAYLAMRPESIRLTPPLPDSASESRYLPLKSRLQHAQLLGSLVRYTFIHQNIPITVDTLNRSPHELLPEGTEHTIYIDMQECITLSDEKE